MFQNDLVSGLEDILHFLKIPVDRARLDCLARYPVNHNQRKKLSFESSSSSSPFCREAEAKIVDAVAEVDKALAGRNLSRLPIEKYKFHP